MLGTKMVLNRFVMWDELGTDLFDGHSVQSTVYFDNILSSFLRVDIIHTMDGKMFTSRVWFCEENGLRNSYMPIVSEVGLTREEALEYFVTHPLMPIVPETVHGTNLKSFATGGSSLESA
jgi:hypothetical protein